MIRLLTLGSLDLLGTDAAALRTVLAQPRRAALLAYLALARPRGLQRRDALLAVFWPESDPAHARDALSSALRHLRRGLGTGVLVGRGDDEIGLAPDRVWTDAVAFERAIDEGRAGEALGLYRGDLLHAFHISDARGFDEWLEGERARLKGRAVAAARTASDERVAAGNIAGAIEAARLAVSLDPDDERARRRLIELLDGVGDRAGALRVYDEFAGWLGAQFGTDPSTETRALVRAIRARDEPAAGLSADSVVPRRVPEPERSSSRASAAVESSDVRTRIPRSHRLLPLLIGLAATAAVLVAALAWHGQRNTTSDEARRDVIAVLPFRVTSPDGTLDYLREGIVDLLGAQLTGEGIPRALDSRTTLVAWRSAAGDDGGDLTTEQSLTLARRLGATRALLGELVVVGRRKTLSARLLEVPGGRVLSEHTETGSEDELLLLHRLTGRLLAQSMGEGATRLPILSDSLAAVKEYLAGMRAFRRAENAAASAHFERALEIDSAFAVVALWLTLFDSMSSGQIHETTQRAWRLRHGLSARDRALLEAHFGIGPNYPGTSSMVELLAASERAARLNPDRTEVWYDFGSNMLVHGPQAHDDWRERAIAALDSAIALDSTFGPAVRWRFEAALASGSRQDIIRFDRLNAALNSAGDYIVSDRWAAALALGDTEMLAAIERRLDDVPDFRLSGWHRESALHGLPLAPAERVIRHRIARGLRDRRARRWFASSLFQLAVLRGRLGEAAVLADSLVYPAHVISAALAYPGLDSPAAAAAGELGGGIDTTSDADRVCFRELFRTSRGDTSSTTWAIGRIRYLVRDLPPAGYPLVGRFDICPLLLDAMREHQRTPLGPAPALDALESVMIRGPGLDLPGNLASLMVARWRFERGEHRAALRAVRRRPLTHNFLFTIVLPAHLREEGRLAALVGDTTGAIRAYQHFVVLRDQPDPGLIADEVRQVQAHLADLTKGKRR